MVTPAVISDTTRFGIRLSVFVGLILWLVILLLDSSASATRLRILKHRRKFMLSKASRDLLETQIPWETRFEQAESAICELIETLPPEIRKEADRVKYILEKWPPSGTPQSYLGRCLSFEPQKVSDAPGPLFIFIGPHHAFCERWNIDFAKEIRRTYLHELGHHLGLDETDLDARGIG